MQSNGNSIQSQINKRGEVMEDIQHMLLYFLALAIPSVAFIFLGWVLNNNNNNGIKLPPGSKGLPFIGETLKFVGVPAKFINDRVEKHSSNIFYSSLLGENMALCCGPSGNKSLFTGQDKYVASWMPKVIHKIMLDPSNRVDHSAKEDKGYALRLFLLEFLNAESLQHYIPIMDSVAKQHLTQHWSPYQSVEVYPLSKKYTFTLSCNLFMRLDDPATIANVSSPFQLVTTGLFSLPINLPGTRFNQGVKGAKRIRQELIQIIRKRKLEMMLETKLDFLSRLIVYRGDNGEPLREVVMADMILGTLVASHDTTSTAITFAINYLAEYPQVYQKVYQEQMEVVKSKTPGELLNWEDMKKMKYTWNVVMEAMRFHPPSSGGYREATANFTCGGYTIPKGWKMHWSVHSTHKNPKYFAEPDRFDPSRFEGDGPAPYTFVPFGGGPRMCPGREYARLEILAFIHNAVTRFSWEKMIPDEKINYIPTPVPMNNLPISLKQRN